MRAIGPTPAVPTAVLAAVMALTTLGALPAVPAHADALPSGSLGMLFGVGGGTGRYARSLGLGYYLGGQAAWQPMRSERRIGWSTKWSFVFGTMYGAESNRIDVELRTLQMDLMAGLRIRPGSNPGRYLALRGGVELFRANEAIQPDGQRAFVGAVAAAAFEQYLFGVFMLNVDVRYGLIGQGPASIALLVGGSISVF
jgi:hypothetical protein